MDDGRARSSPLHRRHDRSAMPPTSQHTADLEKLKGRIQALRAKTVENGCTEEEALSAAAKVADLLDQYDLSLTDVELREEACERAEFER